MSDDDATGPSEPGGATPVAAWLHPFWIACMLAGTAGVLGFGVGEMSYGAFRARSVLQRLGPGMSDRPTVATKDAAMVRNAALAYAGWGASLGLSLGLAGSLIHRSPTRRSFVGMVIGGAAGALLPAFALPFVLRAGRQTALDPLIVGTLSQAVLWGLIAAAAGLGYAFASGAGRRTALRYALAAMGGAMLGAMAYAAIGASCFPMAESDLPLASDWQPRLLARLLPALGAALALEWSRSHGRAVTSAAVRLGGHRPPSV